MQYNIDYRQNQPVLCKGTDVIARFEPLAWPDDMDTIANGANRLDELEDIEGELSKLREELADAVSQIAYLEELLGDLQAEDETLPA